MYAIRSYYDQVGARLAPNAEWIPGPPQPVSVSGGEIVSITVPVLPENADIVGALWDRRNEVVVTGVPGYVQASNPWATIGDT